ncbi:MAG: DUF2282 domain-containing protein [Robiginitomaculum sp.]|nr:DUF2282 domain-containing protein [Robiginitomaculum sp.]
MNAPVKISIATGASLALALVAGAASADSMDKKKGGKEKCYGIALAGENGCGNLAKTHSCQGQSTVDYDVGEWKYVSKGTCADTVITDSDGNERNGMSKKQAKEAMKT